MDWWFHWWLLTFVGCARNFEKHSSISTTCSGSTWVTNTYPCQCHSGKHKKNVADAQCCMKDVDTKLTGGNSQEFIKALQNMQEVFEVTEVVSTTSISSKYMVALLDKPKPFTGLKMYANASEAKLQPVLNSKVTVELPGELGAGPNNTVVFCMVTLPVTNSTILESPGPIYENILIGLSVSGKNVTGLQERVNITINVTTAINETQKPMCVFFNFSNFSTEHHSTDGCQTLWERGQAYVTCSCDHLTYFGILMVNSLLSAENQTILSYITLIGCSLSLIGLTITVLLFIIHKKIRADVSMKVHISLVIALILLNIHFLPSQIVAASSTSLCIYMAVGLHYSLLATFSWMGIEGFHLYILLVRVFNIYIRRYLLKLSVVGWGIPAVIVALVVIIDRTAYGYAVDSNGIAICYVTNTTVKMVTTLGMFGLVFIFNVIMFGVTVQRFIRLRQNQECGQSNRSMAKREIFTLLGITILLGIPWVAVSFSMTTPGQYIFCILDSLQGFFIFLWFVMSLRKARKSAAELSNETRSTNELNKRHQEFTRQED